MNSRPNTNPAAPRSKKANAMGADCVDQSMEAKVVERLKSWCYI
jgi:hypothetical protein